MIAVVIWYGIHSNRAEASVKIVVFGANGPTGRFLVEDALARGRAVRAITRHPAEFPLRHERLDVLRADVADGSPLNSAIAGCDAVASVLGASYSRKRITVYSRGTRAIVLAMQEVGCRRLIVVSSGLTYPPGPGHGFFFDRIAHPLLRNVIGRTLYADMRRMEEYLRAVPDIDWTVMRPGRLVDGDVKRPYLKEPETPSRRYTTRRDLAKAILDDLDSGADVHKAVAVTSR
jgi:nucleoside-diphosphate-sugar epimerase